MDYIYNNFYIKDNYNSFVSLLEISNYFNNVDSLNRVIRYIDERNGKVFVYDTNVNLENIATKFSDQKSTIEWVILSSQMAFFAREKNQERWKSKIPWLNKDNIDIIYDNLKHLAFTEEIDFSRQEFKDLVILGTTYVAMEKRLLYLISKLNKVKADKITFLTAYDRIIEFDKKLYDCTSKSCLNRIFSKIDNTSEQKVFFKYFKKTKGIRYFFSFTKKFKEAINDNVTEKTMADILLHNYKSKINKINSRVLGSYADKKSGRLRANTGDTIITLLKEDQVKNINDLNKYAFISGQPHIETQKIVTIIAILEYFNMSAISDDFSIEFVGYGNELQKTEQSIKQHMQTFAGTLFMKYILLLSQQNRDLNSSKDYATKNLSYDAVKNLITIDSNNL